MSRYNIFYTPHKVWRAVLNDLRAKVKTTDYTDPSQVRVMTSFAGHVFEAHKFHTTSENEVLAPALKQPGLTEHWIDVHGMHGEGIEPIHHSLSLMNKCSNPDKLAKLGSQLSYDLESFASHDYHHTRLEEGFFPMYSRLYSEQELFDLDVKATSYWNRISDDAKETIFPYFVRAHSGDDVARILKIFKIILNDNPNTWQKFVEMAKKEMKPGQITKYEEMKLFD